jgi:hypothetical protein
MPKRAPTDWSWNASDHLLCARNSKRLTLYFKEFISNPNGQMKCIYPLSQRKDKRKAMPISL